MRKRIIVSVEVPIITLLFMSCWIIFVADDVEIDALSEFALTVSVVGLILGG
jgi:hypothetical protein